MKVAIAGSSITDFGELWEQSLFDLLEEATLQAVADAELALEDIDAVFVANMGAAAFEGQAHLGAVVSSFFPHFPRAMRIEGACASGGLALLAAEQAIASGRYETVLVVGAEKMTDVSAEKSTAVLAGAASLQEERGSTFPALYALLAQQHMLAYGTTREQLSAVSEKNHRHAMNNPHAQFQKKVTSAMVTKSALIAEPLRLLDCSPLSDGAAAVVLTTQHTPHTRAWITGVGHASDVLTLAQRDSLTSLSATKKAAEQAYSMTGYGAADFPVMEVHDCFTIAELIALEDLGVYSPGKAGPATSADETTYGGRVVVNPSGGLKACGHPVGATGIKQIAYLAQRIYEGQYERALAHNVGGSGTTAVVHILEGERGL